MAIEAASRIRLARHYVARWMIHTALKIMPPGRFRAEVSAALWGINFRVQAFNAAEAARRDGVTDAN